MLQTLNETVEFLPSCEVKDRDNLISFSDQVAALTFLHRIVTQIRDLSVLRTLLAKEGNGINVYQLNDSQMLEILANHLLYGQIKVRWTPKAKPPSATGIEPEPQDMTPLEVEQMEKRRRGERGSIPPPTVSPIKTNKTDEVSKAANKADEVAKVTNETEVVLSKLERSPVDQNSLILDNNIASTLNKRKQGVSISDLQKGEQLSLQKIGELSQKDFRITDTVAEELGDVTHLNKGINLTVNRNSSEYCALLSQLENVKPSPVGRPKGVNDRKIVADAFFAEGVNPTFNVNSEVFFTWITQELLPKLPSKCVIVMDNASFHKRLDIQNAIRDTGHTLLFLHLILLN